MAPILLESIAAFAVFSTFSLLRLIIPDHRSLSPVLEDIIPPHFLSRLRNRAADLKSGYANDSASNIPRLARAVLHGSG